MGSDANERKNRSGESLIGKTEVIAAGVNRYGRFHFNRAAIQKIGFVFVLPNGVKDGLAHYLGPGNHRGMKNITILINPNCHDNDGFDASVTS